MDPLDAKELKRAAMKVSIAEGPLGEPKKKKKIHHVMCLCPSIETTPKDEGVVLTIPSEALQLLLPWYINQHGPKAVASLFAP